MTEFILVPLLFTLLVCLLGEFLSKIVKKMKPPVAVYWILLITAAISFSIWVDNLI